jgi:hypothetical protein
VYVRGGCAPPRATRRVGRARGTASEYHAEKREGEVANVRHLWMSTEPCDVVGALWR